MGTRFRPQILRVVDGDTILIQINGQTQTARLLGNDTEESHQKIRSKGVTNAGKAAALFAEQYWWGRDLELEFESNEPLEICLYQERDYFGRLKVYAWSDNNLFNLELVRRGLSPYFTKYGYSKLYHHEFQEAQKNAQQEALGIWGNLNAGAQGRDYDYLLPWWERRASTIEQFRLSADSVILDLTKPCDNQCSLIRQHSGVADFSFVCFVDLLGGATGKYTHGINYTVGFKKDGVRLWIQDDAVISTINNYFSGEYAYIQGRFKNYRGLPQVEVTAVSDRSSLDTERTTFATPDKSRENMLENIRSAARRVCQRSQV
jgi:micrococcal nuclease